MCKKIQFAFFLLFSFSSITFAANPFIKDFVGKPYTLLGSFDPEGISKIEMRMAMFLDNMPAESDDEKSLRESKIRTCFHQSLSVDDFWSWSDAERRKFADQDFYNEWFKKNAATLDQQLFNARDFQYFKHGRALRTATFRTAGDFITECIQESGALHYEDVNQIMMAFTSADETSAINQFCTEFVASSPSVFGDKDQRLSGHDLCMEAQAWDIALIRFTFGQQLLTEVYKQLHSTCRQPINWNGNGTLQRDCFFHALAKISGPENVIGE